MSLEYSLFLVISITLIILFLVFMPKQKSRTIAPPDGPPKGIATPPPPGFHVDYWHGCEYCGTMTLPKYKPKICSKCGAPYLGSPLPKPTAPGVIWK